jgi:archaemetzincin
VTLQVTIVPIGQPDRPTVVRLANDLAAEGFGARVSRGEAIPPDAYDGTRNQYRADRLLDALRGHEGERVLGVTDVDLYAGTLNFVLGIAEQSGRRAVISLARLRIGADAERYRARVTKEAVHELGHTLGLGHCPDPACVMYFSNSLADTDRKGSRYCAACRKRLGGP